jgi:hypothetical protein
MKSRLQDSRSRDEIHSRMRSALLAAAILLAACTPVASQTPPPKEATVEAVSLRSVTEAALYDAMRLTGFERSKLVVIEAQAVTWQNASLGCPQPGMAYTDALVPGYRVRIQAGERELDYHASSRGSPVLCPEGRAIDPLPIDSQL